MFLFFFKQKTAYEMRISDWSSDVCSSDLPLLVVTELAEEINRLLAQRGRLVRQIALAAQYEDGAPYPVADYHVVRWFAEAGFLVDEDFELFDRNHRTTLEDLLDEEDDAPDR